MTIDVPKERLLAAAGEPLYPRLFVTVSGAHLYGFPSPDSDWDLRGVHVLPARQVVGLLPLEETIEVSAVKDGLDLDLVTHDVRKFFQLLLRRNGYVLEQLHSPLVLLSSPEHQELRTIARGLVTKHHSHHYLGFAESQWRLFSKEQPPRVKPLLYLYRVLLTGIHLMRTGEVEANLVTLNAEARLPFIDELVARKTTGEKAHLEDADLPFHQGELERLRAELEAASLASSLPEAPTARRELNDLLVRIRLGGASAT